MGNIGDIATLALVAGGGYLVWKSGILNNLGSTPILGNPSNTIRTQVTPETEETLQTIEQLNQQSINKQALTQGVNEGLTQKFSENGLTNLLYNYTGLGNLLKNVAVDQISAELQKQQTPETKTTTSSSTLSVLSGTDSYKALQSSISEMSGLTASQKRDLERSLRSKLVA